MTLADLARPGTRWRHQCSGSHRCRHSR